MTKAPVRRARAPLSCCGTAQAGGRIPAGEADLIGWRMYSASLVKKSGNIMKAMNVSSALITISSMPAMAKLRLLVDFANMADRIRKIRFTPGMAYNISVPIQFSTEGCLLLLLFAMLINSSPMDSRIRFQRRCAHSHIQLTLYMFIYPASNEVGGC